MFDLESESQSQSINDICIEEPTLNEVEEEEEKQFEVHELLNPSIQHVSQSLNPLIFKKAALKRFLEGILLELDPKITVGGNTCEYYALIFSKFILEKDCFEHWKVKNDHESFQNWPEIMKMDHFVK